MSRSLFDPLGVDQALYQYMTDRVIAGQTLYVDVWDQNLPGIIAIHWISTRLFGNSAFAFRLFDACWQVLTLVTLAALVRSHSRSWTTGLLAALLYSLAYYGYGYMQTGQREGFAVLPLLVALHAIVHGSSRNGRLTAGAAYFAAGVMCLLAFMIKPPLGLCYGVLWCWILAEACRDRHHASASWARFVGLTVGFLIALAGVAVLLAHLGILKETWRLLIRADMQGYVTSPGLIRSIAPELAVGVLAITGVGFARAFWSYRTAGHGAWKACLKDTHWMAVGIVAYCVFMTAYRWDCWRTYIVVPSLGLLLPAAGALAQAPWFGRARVWRGLMLVGVASFVALVMQGRFSPYQAMPMLACAAGLAAIEIADRWHILVTHSRQSAGWLAICLAAVTHTGVGLWWHQMTAFTTEPYVLAARSLDEHYDRVTKHKRKFPRHATTMRVARRVQELTPAGEPIVSLSADSRLLYYCARPSIDRLFYVIDLYAHFYPAQMRAIREHKPKVILACTPAAGRDSEDLSSIEKAIFDEAESTFGPEARCLREEYRLTEKIDDICLLQPKQVR
ncbi:MAG TPA: glycosyltransferase family 39 protein [Phycisphaerae bacterium]|nr:glycosyltransferase family 39 protein [Phycisphaerae bacterium]